MLLHGEEIQWSATQAHDTKGTKYVLWIKRSAPYAPASASYVTSSCVGPIPPLVKSVPLSPTS